MEGTGKAVRSPAKSALLADAATSVSRGRGFGVHKALDQLGAFAGPLLVAAVVSASGAMWPAMGVLAVPGAIALLLLLLIRRGQPDLAAAQSDPPTRVTRHGVRAWLADAVGAGLPRPFFWYAAAASLTTGELVTFAIIGYHLSTERLMPTASIPLAYAGAMLIEAIAALGVGAAYDRHGAKVLCAVPPLVALVPPLALAGRLPLALAGRVAWGIAVGVQDSTIKALVAELVEPARRATAYGVFVSLGDACRRSRPAGVP